MGSKKKAPQLEGPQLEGLEKELADAKKEIQRLKLENAILYQLEALALEKEARQRKHATTTHER